MEHIEAIETEYKGYKFRSRLEARWAVFFDSLGIEWEYEVEGFELPSGRYLPDFELPIKEFKYPNAKYFYEIKGVPPSKKEKKLASELATTSKHTTHILKGTPWKFDCYTWHNSNKHYNDFFFRSVNYEPDSNQQELEDLEIIAFFLQSLQSYRYPEKEHENIPEALLKAKQARFEYGETGL